MKKLNQLKIGALLSYIIIFLNMFIGVIYTPILTRMLGQAEYGLYSLVTSIIAYFTILDLGFGNAIIIYTAKYRARNDKESEQKLHGSFFLIYLGIGLIVTILGLLVTFNVDKLFSNTMSIEELEKSKIMMGILTFNVAITFPFTVHTSIISAYEQYIFSKIVNIIRIILLPIIMIPLLFMGYKSISLIILTTILNIIVLLSNFLFCKFKLHIKFRYGFLEKKVMFEIFAYSFFIFLNTIIEKVNHEVDKFILGAVSGTIAVSIYSVANQLQSIFTNLSTGISGVLLPKLTKIKEDKSIDEKKEFTRLFIKIGRIQYIVMALVLTGFILFGKEFIVNIWVGEEYIESYYVVVILVLPAIIPLIQNTGLSILQVLNKYKYRTIIFFFIAIINVLISIPLAQKYNAIGSAIGTSIAVLLGQVIILNIYYQKSIKINIIQFWKEISHMTIPVIFTFIIGIILKKIFPINTIISFGIEIIVYIITYMILMWTFALNKEEKEMITGLLRKFKLFYRK